MKRWSQAAVSTLMMVAVCCGDAFTGAASTATVAAAERDDTRRDVIARAQVWLPTDVSARDIKAGPQDDTGFAWRSDVTCVHVEKAMRGRSPKFTCAITPDDEVKVKYGRNNGEVYGEVVATRLLWALGFGADHMYPVTVTCRGCGAGTAPAHGADAPTQVFDPAIIERKMPGREFDDVGWAWKELDYVDESRGGAPRAHRDALRLLAVFIQHSDSKPEQQRILCLDEGKPPKGKNPPCVRPLLMLNDVGLTFGRASAWNNNARSSMNLEEWAQLPVWKKGDGCVGNLASSMTGSLGDPLITEEGRQFLADLLMKLSDRQIADLFEVSRVELRSSNPARQDAAAATVADWVAAFKAKREQITTKRCA